MVEWRIYYSDGSCFDSSQGSPEAAPSRNVICIVFPHGRTGRMVMHGWSWYWYHARREEWWGCDLHGLLSMLLDNGHISPRGVEPIRAVKQGICASDLTFRWLIEKAMDDPDFPVKTERSLSEKPLETDL